MIFRSSACASERAQPVTAPTNVFFLAATHTASSARAVLFVLHIRTANYISIIVLSLRRMLLNKVQSLTLIVIAFN